DRQEAAMQHPSTSTPDVITEMRRELEREVPLYRTIVVGTDGSHTAQEAVRHAVAISSALGAKLHLVSAAPGKPARELAREAIDAPEEVLHTINPREDLAAMLDAIAADVRRSGVDVVCHPVVDVGPADAI